MGLLLRGLLSFLQMTNRKKIKVLFVLPQLGAGGSERVVLDLARNLNKDLFEVFVIFFQGGALEKPLGQVCKKLFHVIKKPGFDLVAMWKIGRIIKENGIQVVNAHHYMPFFYSFPGAKIFQQRKLIFTQHSVPEVEALISSKHNILFKWMLFKVDAVIGVSKEIADSFKENFLFHEKKILGVPNGVDLERFSGSEDRNQVRADLGLAPDHFVVGTVANFRRVKNHACLIRALCRLKGSYPKMRLLFVGRGFPGDKENSEKDIRQLIEDNELEEQVVFAGYREDIPRIFTCFDVFCLPSFSEGLPVSVLEAMAAVVPVVGSNVRGIREVVSTGKTGLLFPSDDDNSLSSTLEKLVNNPELRERLKENAYAYVTTTHGLKEWILKYEYLFGLAPGQKDKEQNPQ